MIRLKVPPDGLTISHNLPSSTSTSTEPPQVIRLDLVENVTKDILRSLKNNEQVRLRFGKKASMQVGKKTFSLESNVSTFPSEVFSKSAESSGPLYFSGSLSHILEVQNAQEATAKSDEALATLENTLKSIQEQRASNEASFVRSREDMKQVGKRDTKPSPLINQPGGVRKDRFLGALSSTAPSSPFLSASYSPRHGPTSAPLPTGPLSRDKLRLEAMRIPLLHLLAIKPMTPKSLEIALRAPGEDCERILEKVARDSQESSGKKELKEKSFKELDVWKFPYAKEEDRQAAIDHAIQAFDRLRVEKTDPLWQLLLPVNERGKGKILSRLNFDKPPPSQSTSKQETSAGAETNTSKQDNVERDNGKARKKSDQAKSSTTAASHKVRGDEKDSKAKKSEVGASSKAKDNSNQLSKSSKAVKSTQETKYKSSERIEDSDEEAEAADALVIKAPASVPAKQQSSTVKATSKSAPSRPISPSPKKITHKTNPSNSSSSSDDRSKKDFNVSKKHLDPGQKHEANSSRLSPRARKDSSPQKPSPLGSSPPTNSTDIEHSTSSKASSQSSAPSSPPSSTEMQSSNNGNKYSPVITEKRNIPRGRSPVKRKVDHAAPQPPAKRHQTNGVHAIAITTTISNPSKQKPLANMKSELERSSSPEKPGPNRDDVIDNAKRFQKYYKKYKDLHERISRMSENDRDEKDMEDLWKMHKRLKEMKAEIWDNWERVEKSLVSIVA